MLRIIALKAEHLLAVQMQPAQGHGQRYVTEAMAGELVEADGIGWAGEQDGRIIACAGILQMHEARGCAWAMFATDALAHFKTIHRVVLAVLAASPWQRIEMTVDTRHAAACRWAHRLGFAREGLMRAYTPDGRDCYLYARIKAGD